MQDIETMLSIVEKTRNLPKLAPIHNAAMKVLEAHAEALVARSIPSKTTDSDPVYPKPTEDLPEEKKDARRA